LLPPRDPAFNRTQVRKLRDELGSGGLKLEGPFSDRDGAVAEIADRVRCRARRLAGSDEIKSTIFTLMHQDVLPPGFPEICRSQLEFPFVSGLFVRGSHEQQETAGAIANKARVTLNGKEARRVTAEELTMLGVSVLRSLGIESYYLAIHFDASHLNAALSPLNADVRASAVPSIGILIGKRLEIASLSPIDAATLGVLPISSLEALDNDAVLSILKMSNAWTFSRSLMRDIREEELQVEEEGCLRSMEIGHTLFDGVSLWALEDALSGAEAYRQMFGRPEESPFRSIREEAEERYARALARSQRHAEAAARILLCGALQGEIGSFHEKDGFEEILESLPFEQHTCVSSLAEYFSLVDTMEEHVHRPTECGERDGKGS